MRRLLGVLVAGLLLVVAPAEAAESRAGSTTTITAARGDLRALPRGDARPPGRRLRPSQAIRAALAVPEVREARAGEPRSYTRVYLKGREHWQVSVFVAPRAPDERSREIAQVVVRDRDARVLEAWTGVQVAWTMARGYPGAFGRKANAPYVWIPLCVLFVLPFLRPPLRWLHLDLLALLAFSGSYALFGAANLAASVPTAALLLAYLLVRALRIAWRPTAGGRAPPLRLPAADVLGVAVIFLLGFRIALNVTGGNVIDVGYAGVIGADRLAGGEPLYGAFPPDNARGDTYGPVNYLAYVPFELLLPWRGTWDALPAAHAAAIAFDLAAVAATWLLGRRLRGPRFGALLAYLWVSYPFTLLVLNASANDALVAALVTAALLAAGRPASRGALVALAGLTKFAPLALGPLLAACGPGRRGIALTALGFAAAAAAAMAPVALGGDLPAFWDRTLAFQGSRDSPFSPWGWYGGLEAVQAAFQAAAVALALAVAVVPRRRDLPTLAALAAAVLIAAQLAVSHWFYLYLVWFLPPLLAALLAPLVTAERDAGPARSRRPAVAASSG